MEHRTFYKKLIGLIDPAGAKKYITQVTLILFSLFIATTVDRYRQGRKEQVKLQEYLKAIEKDLDLEIETCKMNLKDCNTDINGISRSLHYLQMNHPDSIEQGLMAFFDVFQRGVFRTFQPTTFEMMAQAGEAHLIKDLELRSNLAMVFAFRNNTIKKDLEDYDTKTDECARALGKYVDFTQIFRQKYKSPLAFAKGDLIPQNELFLLLRMANVRGFHLGASIEELEMVKTMVARAQQ
jgi:hypothetical protein